MKVHVISVDEPLKVGADMHAPCGAFVPQANVRFMWEDTHAKNDMMDAAASAFLLCKKCLLMPLDKTYVYGIFHGEGRFHND